jgi:hypothetical protein
MTINRHTPTPYWIDDDGFVAAGSGDSYVTVADVHCRPSADAGDEMEANAKFIVGACNAYHQLVEALDQLNEAAWALDAAIDGATDQFDDEVADLQRALKKVANVRRSAEGSAP